MIDCLLIAFNGLEIDSYATSIKQFGVDSGAYRDLRMNFIKYENKCYDVGSLFNYCTKDMPNVKPLSFTESFSATIAYLGSYLDRNGLTFDYVQDFQFEKEKIASLLIENKVRTIAISTTYFVSVFPIFEIVDFIRSYSDNVKIIIGGPYIFTQINTLDEDGIDYVFNCIDADVYVYSPQGEATLVKVINAIKELKSLDEIGNIYYKNYNDYLFTFSDPENNKLVENPINWDLYNKNIQEWVNLRTSTSCPFKCSFCGSPLYQGNYQVVPVKYIEQDLNKLDKNKYIKNVHFIEDTLNFPPKRFKEILRMLVKNKYKFTWHSYYRCQFADRETVELMKESGCEAVYLGLESGCDSILKNMNKSTTVDKYLNGIELLKEYEILMHGNFIMGFPGETQETVKQTKHFIQNCGIDFFRMQLWYCMPLTPIWERREEFQIKGNSFEWQHSTMDSKTAMDLLEDIYLTVKDPVWTPQHNFDINGLLHLMHRGITLDNLKKYLGLFNSLIQNNIVEKREICISKEQFQQIQELLDHDLIKEKVNI